jgi:hypothetical protein
VLGLLEHRVNIVYGPALISAVEIEKREPFFPGILGSDNNRLNSFICPSSSNARMSGRRENIEYPPRAFGLCRGRASAAACAIAKYR